MKKPSQKSPLSITQRRDPGKESQKKAAIPVRSIAAFRNIPQNSPLEARILDDTRSRVKVYPESLVRLQGLAEAVFCNKRQFISGSIVVPSSANAKRLEYFLIRYKSRRGV